MIPFLFLESIGWYWYLKAKTVEPNNHAVHTKLVLENWVGHDNHAAWTQQESCKSRDLETIKKVICYNYNNKQLCESSNY